MRSSRVASPTSLKISSPLGASQKRISLLNRPQLRKIALKSASEEASGLLDRFWLASGVNDAIQRRRLVDLGVDQLNTGQAMLNSPPSTSSVLPGASSAWFLDGEGSVAEDVARISNRLLALQRLLGDRADVDVVWMVQREPNILTADISLITQRLVGLVTADGAAGVDIVKLIENQPGLLLQEGVSISGSDSESSAQQQLAWSYGLLGDDDVQWNRRISELEQYKAVHGDTHVGFRDGDDAELVRWAAKQRKELTGGSLTEERREKLQVGWLIILNLTMNSIKSRTSRLLILYMLPFFYSFN